MSASAFSQLNDSFFALNGYFFPSIKVEIKVVSLILMMHGFNVQSEWSRGGRLLNF